MAAVAAVGVGMAPSASAAPTPDRDAQAAAANCWYSSNHWWCHNRVPSAVVADNTTNVVVGYLYTNPSWFICRNEGLYHGQGPHPYRWIYTVADNGARGWVKDSDIVEETDILPTCPR